MSPETDFEHSLAQAASALPAHPLPPALRQRILDDLPTATERSAKERRTRLRLASGALAIIVLIAVFWLSAILVRPKDPGAEALAAMQGANTWHISGWKMRHLERVSWEVWGRRKPFFYYEKLGDHITYDDGRYRTEVIPQDVYNGTNSLVIKIAFEPPGYGDGEEYTFGVRGWRRGIRPKRTTAQNYVYETTYYGGLTWETGLVRVGEGLPTQERLYVDKRTLHPDRFQELMSVDKDLPPVVVQDIKIELNKDLPQNIAAPVWPAGSIVMDTTVKQDTSKVPKENVAYKDGFSAQLTPLAMDKNGDVLFRARGWFGNTRLFSGSFAQLGAFMPQSEWALPRSSWPYHDNQGRDYVSTWWPMPPSPRPSGDELLLFSPAAPIKPGQNLPKTMTISLLISAYVGGRYVVGRDIGWTVSLLSTPIRPNFDSFWAQRDPDWRKDWLRSMKQTLPAAADDARSTYWLWRSRWWEGRQFRTDRTALLPMMKWEERAVQDSVPISGQAQFYRSNLANDYRMLHEYDTERSVLRERNSISKNHPGI